MRILLVSQHFYPDNFRVNDIACALANNGHEVTVLTSLPDYTTGKVPACCKGRANRTVEWNGVKVVRTFSVSRRKGLIFRALNYLSFFLSSTCKARRIKQSFDVVLCYQTSPVLMANAARACARKQNIPFMIYCLDLWPESLKAWHVSERNPLFKWMHRYSKRLYNSADLIGVSSKPFMQYLQTVNGVPVGKTVYLPQHAEPLHLPEKQSADQTVFAFGGNIGSVQNVDCIVRAVALLKDVPNFRVEIYGEGGELEKCKALASSLQVEDTVTFFGRVDWQTLKEKYAHADAFLLTLRQAGLIGHTVPAKLQEYMSGARPVIAAIDGASADIIEQSACGICVKAGDSEALANAMRDFMLHREKYAACGANGKAYFDMHFTRKKFIGDLEKYLEDIQR